MIAIVDYSVGNLFSLSSSLKMVGADAVVSGDADVLRKADKILLPGVGAFSDAIKKLKATGLDKVIVEEAQKGKPLLGICLGMQMLFDKSYEYGEYDGLGLIRGSIKPIKSVIEEGLKVPHIGWNRLCFPKDKPKSQLFKYLNEGDYMYFVHSYYAADCDEFITAVTDYGGVLTASVECGNVYGMQFHPEKSGEKGLSILKAFCEL